MSLSFSRGTLFSTIQFFLINLFLIGLPTLAAETRDRLVPNGLEFGDIKAVVIRTNGTVRDIRFLITLRNIGSSKISVLTKNLQNSFLDYSEPPKELHIELSSLLLKDGKTVIPPLATFSPISVKPGASITFEQMYSSGTPFSQVAIVYDMFNQVSEKYGVWRGRIRSAPVPIH